jgi:hypothetical protein
VSYFVKDHSSPVVVAKVPGHLRKPPPYLETNMGVVHKDIKPPATIVHNVPDFLQQFTLSMSPAGDPYPATVIWDQLSSCLLDEEAQLLYKAMQAEIRIRGYGNGVTYADIDTFIIG